MDGWLTGWMGGWMRLWSSAVPWLVSLLDRELRCCSWNLLEPLSQVHRSPLTLLLPSLPTSFVALPFAFGIFRASHVAEVAVTRRSVDQTLKFFCCYYFYLCFYIWVINCLFSVILVLKLNIFLLHIWSPCLFGLLIF